MRVAMIHALAESIPPVRLAFGAEFPAAEVINLLDEGLLVDFPGRLTPQLRRRMSGLIGYCQDHRADAIGLACSVYAPVVDSARELVEVPLVSSYGPVVQEAVAAGPRIGVIASNAATMSDAEYYLRRAAGETGADISVTPRLAPDLIDALRQGGQPAFERRLAEETMALAPDVDVVLLSQFSFAGALEHLRGLSPIPVLSAPHSSARALKRMLEG